MTDVNPGSTSFKEIVIGRSIRAIELENDLLSVTVLVDLGADIHTLVYKPRGVDALWKSPLPAREPGVGPPPQGDSAAVWMAYYRGGWQVICPNFGPAVEYNGAPLDMHGEAARMPWHVEQIENDGRALRVVLGVTLQKSPFRIRRGMSLEAGRAWLTVEETLTNEGYGPAECMWAHHPAFGPPLISPHAVLDTGARACVADDWYLPPSNDIPPGQTGAWPHIMDRAGAAVDLSRLPGPGSGHSRVIHLKDFDQGWYALTNPAIGLGLGVAWDCALFPYATLWQETGGVTGYPWYGRAYVTAVEPASSYPNQGLPAVVEKTGTQLTLEAGQSKTLELRAGFYEGSQRVARIDREGNVHRL